MEAEIADDARFADRAKIKQAREMSPGMKFFAGADLFEDACLWTLAGIAAQFPNFSENERQDELRRRLRIADRRPR